ncbi:MAG: M23 family metallopeptidase [candidate division Zixibacteria bacterium]|nr:M23 family metallopeptidase [candidate division Zixibacteria bacterium]
MRKKIKVIISMILFTGFFYILNIFSDEHKLSPLNNEKEVYSAQFSLGCIFSGTIEKNQPLASALFKKGLPADLIHNLTQALSKVVDLRNCKPGDFFKLLATPEHNLVFFEYQNSLLEKYKVENRRGELVAYTLPVKINKIVMGLEGEIKTSLWEAMRNKCKSPELILKFSDIFAWEIDFLNEPQKGDKFKLIYEEYEKDGTFVSYGDILAAEYETSGKKYNTILYQAPDGHKGYYDLSGKSLRKTFLRSPLNYRRITSRFSLSRLHPIFKTYKPHYGVDYAAPYGTPVVASADGTVTFVGWKKGLGKTIEIKHTNGFVTSYGHLSSVALGIRRGKKVGQGEMIGRVGATGIASGPHLDYRCQIGGRYVDPLKMNLPTANPVEKIYLSDFGIKRENLLYALNLLSSQLSYVSAE